MNDDTDFALLCGLPPATGTSQGFFVWSNMTASRYIVNGLNLELKENLTARIENNLDTVCAITGERITRGIPWKYVIPSSTSEYLDLMHGMTFPYLSIEAAIAFKGSWNMGSRLIFEDGTMYHPYIGADSAEKSERTYWSALVREVWPARHGQNCLCVMAGDFKKKVWPRASIGVLGVNTSVLLFDPDRFRLERLTVDWQRLIDTLDFVERVYNAGFPKNAIGTSLYQNYAALTENGGVAMDWERHLEQIRHTPEFKVSILIAQKGER